MLENNPKDVLNNPQLSRREAALEPVKKKGGWFFKFILILIVIGIIYYLWTHPEIMRGPVNNFMGRFS